MFRRRRTLALLALIPTSLGAGAVSYWYQTSKSQTSVVEPSVALRAAALPDHIASPVPLIVPSSLPSATDIQSSTIAPSELSPVATSEPTLPPPQVEIDRAEWTDDVASLTASLDASAFGHGTTGTTHENTERAVRGGGGATAAFGAGVGSKSSQDENRTLPPAGAETESHHDDDAPGNQSDVIESANDADGKEEPLAQSLPVEDTGSCQQLGCDDTDDSMSSPQYYPPVVNVDSDSKPQVSVPEPGSLGLLGVGLLGALASRRKSLLADK